MKQIPNTIYKCDICGEEFDEFFNCEKHEKSHPQKFAKVFLDLYEDEMKYDFEYETIDFKNLRYFTNGIDKGRGYLRFAIHCCSTEIEQTKVKLVEYAKNTLKGFLRKIYERR